MGILKNALVLGAGYVLGSRAGRERYQQLKQQGTALIQRPQVQEAWQKARGTVTSRASGAIDEVRAKARSAATGPDPARAQAPRPTAVTGTSTSAPAPTPARAPGKASRTTASPDALTEAELDELTQPDSATGPAGRTS